jgi:hypothetical protein
MRTKRELIHGEIHARGHVGTVRDGRDRTSPVGGAHVEQVLEADGEIVAPDRLDRGFCKLQREPVDVHQLLHRVESSRYQLIRVVRRRGS